MVEQSLDDQAEKAYENIKNKKYDEKQFFKDKWKQFKEDEEIIKNSRKNTEKKIAEWEESTKKDWESKTGIKFDCNEEFKDKRYSEEIDEIKKTWNENFPNESYKIEKAAEKLDKENFDKLKEIWENIHHKTLKDSDIKIHFWDWFPYPDKLIVATGSNPKNAKKKSRLGILDAVVIGGLALIGVLMILSGYCAAPIAGTNGITYACGTEPFALEGGEVVMRAANVPLQILESEFILVLISLVIAPYFTKMLKEKYDIHIEESQIAMIMTDGLNSVKMYSKEARNLRDPKTGKIDEVNQRKLRNLAFASLESNYDPQKYKQLVANVGAQVFEKAIEKAVETDKIERFPFEKAQVEEIIKQAIDATPQILTWKDLDPKMKEAFVDGHIRRLLKNVGVEGWAYGVLENVFESEANKRFLAAAVANKNQLLQNLDIKDENLKLLSTVLSSVGDSIAKAPTQEPTKSKGT